VPAMAPRCGLATRRHRRGAALLSFYQLRGGGSPLRSHHSRNCLIASRFCSSVIRGSSYQYDRSRCSARGVSSFYSLRIGQMVAFEESPRETNMTGQPCARGGCRSGEGGPEPNHSRRVRCARGPHE
jgi:hypothetical protein